MLENYRHPDIVNPITERKLELDYYYPELKIAFEYQVILDRYAILMYKGETSLYK